MMNALSAGGGFVVLGSLYIQFVNDLLDVGDVSCQLLRLLALLHIVDIALQREHTILRLNADVLIVEAILGERGLVVLLNAGIKVLVDVLGGAFGSLRTHTDLI